MKHCMIDLETMGVGPDSLILSIGAVLFDPNEVLHTVEESFHVAVEIESHMRIGGRIDAATLEWWMSPKLDEARERLTAMQKIDIFTALDGFEKWYSVGPSFDSIPIWGNGAAFDNTILRSAYRHIGHDAPWSYGQDRCYRTLKNLAPDILPPASARKHDALADARTQAFHLKDIVKHLGLKL